MKQGSFQLHVDIDPVPKGRHPGEDRGLGGFTACDDPADHAHQLPGVLATHHQGAAAVTLVEEMLAYCPHGDLNEILDEYFSS